MKSSLRGISVLTVGLVVGACSGREAAPRTRDDKVVAAPSNGHPAPAAPALSASEEALTATSPAVPPSIVHEAAAPPSTPSDATAAVKDQVDETKKEVFDRPLDPADVQVDRFVLAGGVDQREPVGETDVFPQNAGKIFAFVQLANGNSAPYSFKVHFEGADDPPSPYGITLEVPTAPRFRTWAFTRIKREPGRYRAVLRTSDGQEIARRDFVVVPAADELHAIEPALSPRDGLAD